jgi:chloride channel protein, CIC family
MGATLEGTFAGLFAQILNLPVDSPAFAMVGMDAMVGGATGAAMAAVTTVFETTRDYNIVLPMILAVSASLATRRPGEHRAFSMPAQGTCGRLGRAEYLRYPA